MSTFLFLRWFKLEHCLHTIKLVKRKSKICVLLEAQTSQYLFFKILITYSNTHPFNTQKIFFNILQPLYNTLCRSVGVATTTTATDLKINNNEVLYTDPITRCNELDSSDGEGKKPKTNESNDVYDYATVWPTISTDNDDDPTNPKMDPTEIPMKKDTLNSGYSTVKDINMPSPAINSRSNPLGKDPLIAESDSLNGFYSTVNERGLPSNRRPHERAPTSNCTATETDAPSYNTANDEASPRSKHSPTRNCTEDSDNSLDHILYSTAEDIDHLESTNVDKDDIKQDTLNYYSIPIDEGPKIPLEIQQQYAKVNKKK